MWWPRSATCSKRPKPQRKSKFRLSLGRLVRVYGHSMTPMLHPGEVVLVSENAYESHEPQRGEVVMARPASLGGMALVKRIVGLPHERVAVGGQVWQLEDGQFFLLGDRTEHSMDSRMFGPVNREELVGPVRVRVWPWKRLEPASSIRASRVACARTRGPRRDDDGVVAALRRGGATLEAAACRRNPSAPNRLGRSASARRVARRSRTRLRVRHAPRVLRASPLGPARPRGFMKPVLVESNNEEARDG